MNLQMDKTVFYTRESVTAMRSQSNHQYGNTDEETVNLYQVVYKYCQMSFRNTAEKVNRYRNNYPHL